MCAQQTNLSLIVRKGSCKKKCSCSTTSKKDTQLDWHIPVKQKQKLIRRMTWLEKPGGARAAFALVCFLFTNPSYGLGISKEATGYHSFAADSSNAATTTYVDFQNIPWQDYLSSAVCVGLYNRNFSAFPETGAVYMLANNDDSVWLQLTRNITTPQPLINASTLLSRCLAATGPANGRYISYNSSAQQALVPNIITLAAVLDAVPIDVVNERYSHYTADTAPVFDAVKEFHDFKPIDSTRFVFNNYINSTTGLCKVRSSLSACVWGIITNQMLSEFQCYLLLCPL